MTVECTNIHNEIKGVLARQKYLKRMQAKAENDGAVAAASTNQ